MKIEIPEWRTKALYTVTDLNSKPPKIANPQDWPIQDLLRCIWNSYNKREGYVAALVQRAISVSRSPQKSTNLLNEIHTIGGYLDIQYGDPEPVKRGKKRTKKKK